MKKKDFVDNPIEGIYRPFKIESINSKTSIVMVSQGEKMKDGATSFKQYPLFLDEELIKALPGFLGKDEKTIIGSTIHCLFIGENIVQLMNANDKTFRQYLLEQN